MLFRSMTYKYSKRLISFGEQILDDFREMLGGSFALFSQSNHAGDRAYSCGGRFSLPNDFANKIIEIANSIEPFNTLKNEILKTRSAMVVHEKLIESQIAIRSLYDATRNEKLAFHRSVKPN